MPMTQPVAIVEEALSLLGTDELAEISERARTVRETAGRQPPWSFLFGAVSLAAEQVLAARSCNA